MTITTQAARSRLLGFTLIELMVVIVIVAIMAAIGLPSLRAFISHNRVVTQTNDVLAAIQTARSEATRLNTTVSFCRAASASAVACAGGAAGDDWLYWLVIAPGQTNPVLKRGAITGSTLNLRTSSNIASNSITFRADSLARQADGVTMMSAQLRVCTTDSSLTNNARLISIRFGGRTVVTSTAAGCTAAVSNPS